MRRTWLLSAILGLSLFTPTANADDWTRFRGPNGTGVVEGKFLTTVTEKDFAWKVELPGKGHSSPVLFKEHVYLTSADTDEGKRYVLCLSAANGKTVWKREFDFSKFKQHADNSYCSATPTVDELGVYVAWSTPEDFTLFSLGHDGKDRWKQTLGGFKSLQGQGASPILVEDSVILANDQEGPKSSIAAYDRRTGAQQWIIDRKTSDKTAMSTPVVWKSKEAPAQLIFTSKSSGMTAVDPRTGQVVWELPKIFDARTVGSPVVASDLILGACGEGAEHRLLVAVRPGKAGEEPVPAYSIKRIAPYVPTPVVKGNRIYMWGDAGQVTCAKLDTGEEVWSEKVGGMYYGSPVCVGDALWCMSRKGELVGVSATETYKLLGKIALGEASHATPAVAEGRMYLRTLSHLICVKMKKE